MAASNIVTAHDDRQLSTLLNPPQSRQTGLFIASQRRPLRQGPTIRQIRMRISCEDPSYMGLKKIKITGRELSSLPKSLFDVTELEILDLSLERESCLNYHLKSIPDDISRLRNLTVLAVDGNQLTVLPESVCELGLLERLALSNNRLTALPQGFHLLKNLRSLYCANNKFVEFPVLVTHLMNLTFLDFSDNRITQIPVDIGEMTVLESLVLSYNRITQIPDTINLLRNLEVLWLCGNLLSTLPIGLSRLPRLDWNWMMMSTALDDNPLTHPPLTIAKQGPAAIDKYLSLHQSDGNKTFNKHLRSRN